MPDSVVPTALETYFLQLVNQSRAQAGVKPLTFDGELVSAAGTHSEWMIARDVFSHTGINGSSPGDRIKTAGYGATAWGENIAYIGGSGAASLDEADARQLHTNLMNSPGHKANILSANFTEIGIGLVQGDYNGRPAVMVTENFGRPNSTEAAEPDEIPQTPIPIPPPPAPMTKLPVSLSAGTGSDTLVIKIAQDHYQGDAQYTISIDGRQIGGTFTASALHSAGAADTLTLKGEWAAGAHRVEVKFLNDAWGGTATTDRNLYVEGATYNGQAVSGADLNLTSTGTKTFGFTEANTTPTPLPDKSGVTTAEAYFLQLVNASRAEVGAKPLAFDAELVKAAGAHSDWMVTQDVFSHTGANGSTVGDRIKAAGYGATAWGENIAYISGSGAAVLDEVDVRQLHTNLMNSAGHKANILSTNYTEIGIGLTQGDYNGRPAIFVTENFGRPNSAEALETDGWFV
jgi:uncharacterized protein YkwD